jgi:hypothetical protein
MDARSSAHRARRTAFLLAAPVAIAVLVAASAGTGAERRWEPAAPSRGRPAIGGARFHGRDLASNESALE